YEAGGDIEVLTKCINRRMTVIFKDNGAPFNPLLVQDPDVTLPLSKRKPGGLGIFIVKKLMSDYSYTYENGQNVLKIEMDF
ncbi:MAG: ATP-binding protein, partial [Ruminococcus sp.]|nr:ATP-binding protein [Ruminococcus sp.]